MRQSLISLILFSERRRDLLFLLKNEPKDIDSIKKILKVDAGSIQPHIKKMKGAGLINEKNKLYSLSEIGEVVAENMWPLLNTVEVFEENIEYWKNHDLDSIPGFLLERIDELGHFEVLEPDAGHLAETPKTLLENMLCSTEIMTFVSYFHPEAPFIYSKLAESGAEVTLCITQNVAERLFSSSYREETIKLLRAKNSKIFLLRKQASVPSIIVTDRFLVFKLYEMDGKLRDQMILSIGEQALCWGKELFRHCIEAAEPLNENEFL
jgi:predicted transcriptional regulator